MTLRDPILGSDVNLSPAVCNDRADLRVGELGVKLLATPALAVVDVVLMGSR